ncbi:hypothetical protein R1flu_025942 [Riccia fluitans]|uniref:AAA+ ATPase domain-containing protein n=1 Tax=Riccia fluitans TaxID=41844 RepID=A0ABD1XZ62_9MARC
MEARSGLQLRSRIRAESSNLCFVASLPVSCEFASVAEELAPWKRRATGGKKKSWRKKRKYELGRQPVMRKRSSNKTVPRIRVRGGNSQKRPAGKKDEEIETPEEEKKVSRLVGKKIVKRQEGLKLDSHLEDQFASGRLLACIASRSGQCGRCNGYILEVPSYLKSYVHEASDQKHFMEGTDKIGLVQTRWGTEEGSSSHGREVAQTDGFSVLDFLLSKKLYICSSPRPQCTMLSGPSCSGKTSLLLQLAYNIASEAHHDVVFICRPRNFDSDYVYLAQDVDSSSEVFDRIHIKYVHNEEDLRKYFSAFHMQTSLPTTVIIDDFLDFFQGWDGRHQGGQARSSRDLVVVKTLCLAYDAITYASERYKTTAQCRLILSDSHHSDGPRLSYIFWRWIHQTFVIKAIHDFSAFTLALHDESERVKAVAKYDLSQRYLRFVGWDSPPADKQ